VRRRSPATTDAMCRTAFCPSDEPKSRTLTGRGGPGNGMVATASSTQSWMAWIADSCAVECLS
jgi:hypothetical protein